MQRLGETPAMTGWDERIAGMRRQSAANRAAAIAEHGLAADVVCLTCGDTGLVLGRELEVVCDCEAGSDLHRRRRREQEWEDSVPRRLRRYRLDTCPNGELRDRVRQWVDVHAKDGTNLVVTGAVGRGKTGAAIGACRLFHAAGKTVGYWSAPSLLDQLRLEEGAKERTGATLDTASRQDVLLLDDIGSDRITDYATERLYVLFNDRYLAERPTILTTNLDGPGLADHLGARITSRLKQSCVSIQAGGPDYRSEAAA